MVLMCLYVYRFAEILSRVPFQRRGDSRCPPRRGGMYCRPACTREPSRLRGAGGQAAAEQQRWWASGGVLQARGSLPGPTTHLETHKSALLSFKIRRRINKVLGHGNISIYNRNIFFFFFTPMQLQNRSVNIFYGGSGPQRPKCLRPPEVILHP